VRILPTSFPPKAETTALEYTPHHRRTARAKEELLPLCADTFYRKGAWRGEKVFERDAGGKVIRMLDRRENNYLVWRKVK